MTTPEQQSQIEKCQRMLGAVEATISEVFASENLLTFSLRSDKVNYRCVLVTIGTNRYRLEVIGKSRGYQVESGCLLPDSDGLIFITEIEDCLGTLVICDLPTMSFLKYSDEY